MKINFVPDLFLNTIEMSFLRDGIDKMGWRKAFLNNSTSFGLIKNPNIDPLFTNGLVSRDTDTGGGGKTLKINPLAAVDSAGNLITSENTVNQIPIDDDGNWHWMMVSYVDTPIHAGTVSIDVAGNLSGVGTDFTKTLMGGNFPSKIRLVNSINNVLQYQVLSVISPTSAILRNPAATSGGVAEFAAESVGIGGALLQYSSVGTFTPNVAIPSINQYPMRYDSMTYQLLPESTLNEKPAPYTIGQNFYIARCKVSGSDVIVQDKRNEFWESIATTEIHDIDRADNPLIGVESVMFPITPFNPGDKSIVNIGFGFRSSNWSLNTSSHVLTLASGVGGMWKSVADFTDGSLDGFRVYVGGNGTYSIVTSSVASGGAINLTLDVLDVDNYSTDGGTTFIAMEVTVVPNCDSVEILATADATDNVPSVTQSFIFDVMSGVGRMELEVYKATAVGYNVQYRYKKTQSFTGYQPIPSDNTHGYLTEAAFNNNGVLTGSTRQLYTSDPVNGFIVLQPNPNSYSNTIGTIYKGDTIGVNNIANIAASSAYTLQVNVSKNYQLLVGVQTLTADVVYTLSTLGAVEGNEFRYHINCSTLTMNGHQIYFKQGSTIIAQLGQGAAWQMANIDGGIILDFKFDSLGVWRVSQNFDLGRPAEIVTLDGVISDMFDVSGGVNNALGKVKGLYGYSLCNHSATVLGVSVPNLGFRFLLGEGSDGTNTAAAGDIGGSMDLVLAANQLPAHQHPITDPTHTHTSVAHNHGLTNITESAAQNGADDHRLRETPISGAIPSTLLTDNATVVINSAATGITHTDDNTPSGTAIDITNQYYCVIYAKKLF